MVSILNAIYAASTRTWAWIASCRAANHSQIVIRLQVEPGLGGCPEKLAEPESGIAGDGPLAVHDPAEAHPPLVIDPDAMLSPPVARQCLEAIPRRGLEIAQGARPVKVVQLPVRHSLDRRERIDVSARSKSFRPGGQTKRRRRQDHPAADTDHLTGDVVGEVGREEFHDLGVFNARWR